MRTQAIAGLFFVAALSACSVHQTDPCAGVKTSCLSVRVTGSGKVDSLDITASGAFSETKTSSFEAPEPLPVRIAVVPQVGATGTLVLAVTAHDGSSIVGSGSSAGITLTGTNDHAQVDIALVASSPGDGGTVDQATTTDGFAPQDLSGACTPGATLGCSSGNGALLTCDASGHVVSTVCQFTCAAGDTPHCTAFVPHAPVTPAILAAAGAGTVTLTGTIKIDTDTGLIDTFRTANSDPSTLETNGGIGFQVLSMTSSVFTTGSIVFDEHAVAIIVGTRPFVLVASSTIAVHGVIDARPYDHSENLCPTPTSTSPISAGGGLGGASNVNNGKGGGAGAGSQAALVIPYGGGGGGGASATNAMPGGTGADAMAQRAGGFAGAEVAFAVPIVGGSGGGAGTGSAVGGSGGGAVQLVAGTSITIGDGANVSPMGIMANGCGGAGGIMNGSAGGGGAGGTVLVESPLVKMGAYGAIVTHGGGGGAGFDTTVQTATSGFTPQPVAAAPATSGYASGGIGGGGSNLTGGGGGATGSTSNVAGGGAGGTAGRVVLLNTTGTLTIGANGFVSPGIGQTGTKGDVALVTSQITTQ